MNKLSASILVLIGAASYGLLSTIVKIAYQQGFSSSQVISSQFFFAFLGFFLLCLIKKEKFLSLSKRKIFLFFCSGATSSLTGIFYYLSLQQLTASFAVVLLFQFTWMGIFLEWLLYQKKPTIYHWLAIFFILLGTILATGKQTVSYSNIGIILALLAAASYTLFINFSGNISPETPALLRSFWMSTGAVFFSFLVFPPTFLWDSSLFNGLFFWSIFLASFGILIPFYLFALGVPHIGTGLAAIYGSIELPVVILFSSYILQEQTTFLQWLGIGAILLGVIIPLSKKRLT